MFPLALEAGMGVTLTQRPGESCIQECPGRKGKCKFFPSWLRSLTLPDEDD